MDQVYERLSEPFPQEMERTVSKGGTSLTYLPIAEVTNRMNRVLGVSGWSSEILRCERDLSDPDWVVAHVRVSANIDGRHVIHDGFGGQKIKRSRKDNEVVDLGNEFKGAVSDATKKALQQFGVGLYLARDIDAIEIEMAIQSAPAPVDAALSDKYERFMELRNQLSDDDKPKLKEFWVSYSGGRPVPKNVGEWTVADLEAVTIETTRLILGGAQFIETEGDSE
jgi:hypothetical protein